jgi:hypothetical protein
MKARTAIAAAALLALAACGGGAGGSLPSTSAFSTANEAPAKPVQTEQPSDKAAPCSVIFYGDSITGMTAPLMGKGLQVTVKAQVGGTAQANLAAFLQDPLEARFVAINFGTNDANSETPMQAPLQSMVDYAKSKGRTVVLTGMSHGTQGDLVYHETYDALIKSMAKSDGVLFADWPGVPWSAADLQADGVHPNGNGYSQRLADRLTQAILAIAPECGRD